MSARSGSGEREAGKQVTGKEVMGFRKWGTKKYQSNTVGCWLLAVQDVPPHPFQPVPAIGVNAGGLAAAGQPNFVL